MRTRRKGLKKEIWFSICSRHGDYQENCPLCNKGQWINVVSLWFNGILYKYMYPLWFYKMNGNWPNGTYEDYTGMKKK